MIVKSNIYICDKCGYTVKIIGITKEPDECHACHNGKLGRWDYIDNPEDWSKARIQNY